MTSNPFAPPLALVEDFPDDALATPRRPISVRVLDVVAALAVCVVAPLLIVESLSVPYSTLNHAWAPVLQGIGGMVAVLLVLVATIVGGHRRARFARWTGLVLIALVFGLCACYDVFVLLLPSARQDAGSHVAGNAVALVIAALTLGLIAFWFWAYGFSAKSRAWFVARGAP